MKHCIRVLAIFCTAFAVAEELSGTVVGIADGDTITLLDSSNHQYKIRLTEIDTPEKGQPWGNRAKDALAQKVFSQEVTVVSSGNDRYGRVLGRIYLGDRDINREMVAEGHAWVYRQYMTDESLLEDENQARESQSGLWGIEQQAVPPWEWRRGARSTVATTVTAKFECGSKQYCREMSDCDEAMFYLGD